jgi:hypothetical protein
LLVELLYGWVTESTTLVHALAEMPAAVDAA